MDYQAEYQNWLEKAAEPEILEELKAMDGAAVQDAFYRELEFGTAGLRGVIGAGTNRMNLYTVGKASQGLANYVLQNFKEAPSIAVSMDSRIKSDYFSRVASAIFAANGIKVYIYPELMPTPCLSWAVRRLGCSAGIMVTASHNPAQYNGYKVYGADGCQITTEAADAILGEIEKLDLFADVKTMPFEEGLEKGLIEWIGEDVYTEFTEQVKNQSVLFGDEIDRDVAIVYTPLNGAGLKPVLRALRETGFTNITVVKEQEQPDGNFPTCPYPNPEIREAMALGLEYCEKTGADLLLATDPDSDRCGIAVKDAEGYRLISGNELGLLLLNFICEQRKKHGRMPEHPVFVKSIVTTDLAGKVAAHYGVETVNVLTGFKYIGEVIGRLEAQGHESDYICGFEESYGYLTGSYVRDKDAVDAAFMICEMFAYYKTRGISLLQKLAELYSLYGYVKNAVYSFEFDGSSGMLKMQELMKKFRLGLSEIGGRKVEKSLDYGPGLNGLPKADVLQYFLEDGSAVIIRPSGTEPKLKIYVTASGSDETAAKAAEKEIVDFMKTLL